MAHLLETLRAGISDESDDALVVLAVVVERAVERMMDACAVFEDFMVKDGVDPSAAVSVSDLVNRPDIRREARRYGVSAEAYVRHNYFDLIKDPSEVPK